MPSTPGRQGEQVRCEGSRRGLAVRDWGRLQAQAGSELGLNNAGTFYVTPTIFHFAEGRFLKG